MEYAVDVIEQVICGNENPPPPPIFSVKTCKASSLIALSRTYPWESVFGCLSSTNRPSLFSSGLEYSQRGKHRPVFTQL